MIFLFLLLFLPFRIDFNIVQKEAILGEPIIVEIEQYDFGNFWQTEGFYIDISGPEHCCIDFMEIKEIQRGNRLNITNWIRKEGEYEIMLIFDDYDTCKIKNITEEEKMDNKALVKNFVSGIIYHQRILN